MPNLGSHRGTPRRATLLAVISFGVVLVALAVAPGSVASDGDYVRIDRPTDTSLVVGGNDLTIQWDAHTNDLTTTGYHCDVYAQRTGGSEQVIVEDKGCASGSNDNVQTTWTASEMSNLFPDTETDRSSDSDDIRIIIRFQDSLDQNVATNTTEVELDTLKPRIEAPTFNGSALSPVSESDPAPEDVVWTLDTTSTRPLRINIKDSTLKTDAKRPSYTQDLLPSDPDGAPDNKLNATCSTCNKTLPSTRWGTTIDPSSGGRGYGHGDVVGLTIAAEDKFRTARGPSDTSEAYAFGFDTEDPTLSSLSNSTSTSHTDSDGQFWVAGSLTLSVDARDPVSGAASVDFTRTPESGSTPDPLTVSNSSGSFGVTFDTTSDTATAAGWSNNTTYMIGATTLDRAGNPGETTTSQEFSIGIDNWAPDVTLQTEPEIGPDRDTLRWTVEDLGSGVDPSTITVYAETAPGSGKFTSVSKTTTRIGPDSFEVTHTVDLDSRDDGTYEYSLSVDDNLTQNRNLSRDISIDSTGPDPMEFNITLQNGDDYDDDTSSLQYLNTSKDIYWLTGDQVDYSLKVVDNTTSVARVHFTEQPDRVFTRDNVSGPPQWFTFSRDISNVKELGPFTLNATAEDTIGNIKQAWDDPDVSNITIGFDRQAPRVKLPSPSSAIQFAGTQSISVDLLDKGSGVNVSSHALHNMSVKFPGSSSYKDLQFTEGEYDVRNVSGDRVRFTYKPDVTLEEGTYKFRIEGEDNLTQAVPTSRNSTKIDLVDVTVKKTGQVQQRGGVPVRIQGNHQRLGNATFFFARTDDATPVSRVQTDDVWDETFPIDTDDGNVTVYEGETSAAEEGDAPLGSYHLKVNVSTRLSTGRDAESSFFLIQDQPIDLSPKLNVTSGPFLEDRHLNATIHAAYQGTRTATDAASCQEKTRSDPLLTTSYCDVSRVAVEGLFEVGDGEEWRFLQNQSIPNKPVESEEAFEYTFDYDLNSNESKNFLNQVRITSNVTFSSDPADQHETREGYIVGGPGAQLLTPKRPTKGEVNGTGDLDYALDVQLPETLDPSDAAVELSVADDAGNQEIAPVRMNAPDGGGSGIWRLNTSEEPDVPVLSEDKYTATFHLLDTSGSSDEVLLERNVGFFVETDDPTVTHRETPWTTVDGINWIGQEADLNITINAGFAQIRSLDQVTVKYDLGETVITPDIEWKNESMEDARFSMTPYKYRLDGTVEAPAAISHDTKLLFAVRAQNNASGFADGSDGLGYQNDTVRLDKKAPTLSGNRTFSELLGTFTHNESLTQNVPSFRINVSEEGVGLASGAGPIEARFYKRTTVDGNVTFVPWITGGGFGSQGDTAKTFELDRLEDGVWVLDVGKAPDLLDDITSEPLHRYAVNMTATDLADNTGNLTRFPIAADLGAPSIASDNVTQAASEDGTFDQDAISINWGNASKYGADSGHLHVNATIREDTGLESSESAHVLLKKPNGDRATTDMSVSCQTQDNGPVTWCTWDITGTPIDRVGTYRLGVSATDTVGNFGLTRNATDGSPYVLAFEVNDTIAPANLTTSFFPEIGNISEATNLRAQLDAFDDAAIKNATVTWVNVTDGDNVTRVGPVDVTNCAPQTNDSDPRTARCSSKSDSAGVDFATGDTWKVEWKVWDTANKTSTVESAVFDIKQDAPPAVERISPPSGSEFISDDPGLVLRVQEPAMPDPPDDAVVVRAREAGANFTSYGDFTVESATDSVHFVNVTPPDISEGSEWTVQVNITDTTDRSTSQKYTFTIDKTAPSIDDFSASPTATRGGTTWVAPSSEFTVTANDGSSGIASVQYKVGDGSFQDAGDGFTLPSGASGEVTVTVRVTDNAGNRATDELTVTVDDGPPSIENVELGRTVSAKITDGGVGLDPATVGLFLRTSGSSEFPSDPIQMTKSSGNIWTASVPSSFQGQICAVIEADDRLGNTGRSRPRDNPQCFGTANQPPTLSITSPSDGTTVKDTFQVTWDVSDPNGDQVSIGFEIKAQGSDAPRSLDPVSQSEGQATLDVSGLEDGQYTLTVRANDGAQTAKDTRSITVLNTDVVQTVSVPDARLKSSEDITVEVDVSHPFKSVSDVSAVIERNGETVDTVPMENTEGSTYRLEYTPEEPGSYNVSVEVSYQDGSSETFHVSSFTATPGADTAAGLAAQLVALVVMGAVVVGMAGYGAFGRWNA